MSVSWTAEIFGDWGGMRKSTYIGGIGQAVKPLLDAEEFTGNGNGLGRYNIGIARSRNPGQCFLLARASSVYIVSVVPLHAIFLEGPKALIALGPQRNAALKFWSVEGANPGCSLMWYGVDSFSPSSWEPQEDGMMNIAARFSLS
jgi:hypothetical protein